MAYDDTMIHTVSTVSGGTGYTLSAPVARSISQSPMALEELAKASSAYAAAAGAFIEARDNLTDARVRWAECRDAVAKATEQENV